MTKSSLIIAVLVLGLNLIVWATPPLVQLRENHPLEGVAYSPFREAQDPFLESYPSTSQIEEDMQVLQDQVSRLRTYGATHVLEEIPRLAGEHQLEVTLGVWLDRDLASNELEISNAVALVGRFQNIDSIIVGNEAVLRGDLSVEQLSEYIRRVKERVSVPVGSAEPWHVWLEHPQMVEAVDFIAIHVLPYWEGVPLRPPCPSFWTATTW